MALVDRIRSFRPPDFARLCPFRIDGMTVGWMRRPFAETLREFPEIFTVEDHQVVLDPDFTTPAMRSDALATAVATLHAAGVIRKIRGETFPVSMSVGSPPLLVLDRGAIPHFGTRACGVHLNGYVGRGTAMKLWVGRRAKDKSVAPGKFDNLVAGGQPSGLGLFDTLIKEGREEADMAERLVRQARPTGFCSYLIEHDAGIRNDLLFNFDLELPAEFEPRNTDGEIDEYQLWPIADVIERMAETEDFKFNVVLVNIDFLVRHGLLTPDDADYVEIVRGLHR
ncbi:MAG: DUF4743 domain-containing protein [Dongiaceae bacterium]